ncbi:MAG: OmcA/MtrC family decaheme c-type cytochrome [Polyangiaceae bacterium]|nr:OmcA/MtrC family decaheme c-type cytochrome [Polyangiaceae bacterium]
MPAWTTTTRLMTAFLFGGAVALAGCEGPEGPPGLNGANGLDGADGTDGTNGTNGTDGTNGTNGTNGTDGLPGQDGQNYQGSKVAQCSLCHSAGDIADAAQMHPGVTDPLMNLNLAITQVSNNAGALAVTFTASDAATGNPITNLTMAPLRFMFNQYLPKANAYENAIWSEDKFYEQSSTSGSASRFVQSPPGTYTYTFLETIAQGVANDGVNVAYPTQVVMRVSGFGTYNRANAVYQMTDIAMAAGATATPVATPVGEIVTTAACESCHGPRIGNVGHGGGYNKVEYCRNCHTQDPASTFTDGGVTTSFLAAGLDLRTMIHQIHSAIDHTKGGVDPGFDWTEVTYPQDTRNCDKCHQGVDGDRWNTLPTRSACGSCHFDISFVSPAPAGMTLHTGGAQATNQNCGLCHDPATIRGFHVTDVSTPNNPDVPPGASNFTYQINSVTVDAGGVPTVNFAILKDGVAITDLQTTYPPTGFTGGPSFLLSYSQAQDGVTDPVDWNNLGKAAAQPQSVSLQSVATTLTPGAVAGTYDVALTAATFPAGSTRRAVGMNAYFTQVSPAVARHTTSVVKAVTGDAVRRDILQVTGCVDCHEIFEGHGGSRVIAADTVEANNPLICLQCHVPNLSSSGRTFDMAGYTPGSNADTDAAIALFGNDSMLWPEDTNNFKDLIHGIHSSDVRVDPYEFVRIRGGNAYGFDWSEVRFPNNASRCGKCHTGTSYAINAMPTGVLATTKVTDNGAITDAASVTAARATVPNDDDLVLSPVVAACNSCHNGATVEAHMDQNGGGFGLTRAELLAP